MPVIDDLKILELDNRTLSLKINIYKMRYLQANIGHISGVRTLDDKKPSL